ncbi:hypothetical protein OAE33_00590 [Akkermansiaceae bacterium]|nr:hypothetical protein [Akkermansiaceae bacterium]
MLPELDGWQNKCRIGQGIRTSGSLPKVTIPLTIIRDGDETPTLKLECVSGFRNDFYTPGTTQVICCW